MNHIPFKQNSLIFAPMEGITNGPYRIAVSKAFPEWDYFSTDFYRIPTIGNTNKKSLLKHYGEKAFLKKSLRKKTSYQILTTAKAQTENAISIINEFDLHHLDLNLGCPSKKVNAHRGGAFLLQSLEELAPIIRTIRKNFKRTFTVKIRLGYKNDLLFFDLLKMFEDEGVDAITIHARTKEQLYKGKASWEYIKEAVKACSIPIIGNGDIWTIEDIIKIFDECSPYAIMVGRGALKTPWLASLYYNYKENKDFLSEEFLLEERRSAIDLYFFELEREYLKENENETFILKRFKAFSRYLFDDFPHSEKIKSKILRSLSLNEFKDHLNFFLKK